MIWILKVYCTMLCGLRVADIKQKIADEKKVLLNINENNQQHAQIGYFGEVETLKNLYDKIIEQQRSEIDFLRSLLKDKS